jgi:hypothetical protein
MDVEEVVLEKMFINRTNLLQFSDNLLADGAFLQFTNSSYLTRCSYKGYSWFPVVIGIFTASNLIRSYKKLV